MEKRNITEDTITLRGKEIPVTLCSLPISELYFYPENPRIYSIVCGSGEELEQKEIQERLATMDHVKQLVQSIRANGGLTDPIIVRYRTVLEGNSRLAAYRLLAKSDPIRWGEIKCKVLPKDIGDDLIFAVLGEYHIIGKKDWAPYEVAGYLYRRNRNQGVSIEEIVATVGLKKGDIEHLIGVYSFMVENGISETTHWSYYDEYLKSKIIKKAREEYPKLDFVMVKKIETGEIERAADVRDKLKIIAQAKARTLKRFVGGEKNFYQAYEMAIDQGTNEHLLRRLHRFREWVCEGQTREGILSLRNEIRDKCEFEMKKILRQIDKIMGKLEKIRDS